MFGHIGSYSFHIGTQQKIYTLFQIRYCSMRHCQRRVVLYSACKAVILEKIALTSKIQSTTLRQRVQYLFYPLGMKLKNGLDSNYSRIQSVLFKFVFAKYLKIQVSTIQFISSKLQYSPSTMQFYFRHQLVFCVRLPLLQVLHSQQIFHYSAFSSPN